MSFTESVIELGDEAEITPPDLGSKRETKLTEIISKISDTSTPPVEISRLICYEIALILNAQFEALETDPLLTAQKIKYYESVVKSLRQLGQQLNDTDVFSKKDVLNFDGRKFQWVVQEIIKLFKSSILESGNDETMANSVLKNFRDAFSAKETEFRQGVDKIDSSAGE